MRNSIAPLLFCILLSVSCESTKGPCGSGDVVHTFAQPTTGALNFDEEFDLFNIRYFVPGTIDASLVGYLCNEPETDFELKDGLTVLFTGNFREAPEDFSPSVQVAGSEFFIAELKSLELESAE